jgi:hypothetical protein
MLKKEFFSGLRLVMGTELIAKKKFKQLDHWQYQYFDTFFGIMNWLQEELQKLDRKKWKLLYAHGEHHLKQT